MTRDSILRVRVEPLRRRPSSLLLRLRVSRAYRPSLTQRCSLPRGQLHLVMFTAAPELYVSHILSVHLHYRNLLRLDGLAVNGNAPKLFSRVNRWGLPYVAVATSSAFGLLAYMAVSSGAGRVFTW